MDIASIGTLVSLAKTLAETINKVGQLIGKNSPWFGKNQAEDEFNKLKETLRSFYQRLDGLTNQLEKSDLLIRIVEAWLQVVKRMKIPHSLDTISDAELNHLHEDIRGFLADTHNDYFSSAFFNTDFKQFPEVEKRLEIFRDNLTKLRPLVEGIPYNNIPALRAQWPTIVVLINHLRTSGEDVSHTASDVRNQLIQELRESARHP